MTTNEQIEKQASHIADAIVDLVEVSRLIWVSVTGPSQRPSAVRQRQIASLRCDVK